MRLRELGDPLDQQVAGPGSEPLLHVHGPQGVELAHVEPMRGVGEEEGEEVEAGLKVL
jgi:hypothetical protein